MMTVERLPPLAWRLRRALALGWRALWPALAVAALVSMVVAFALCSACSSRARPNIEAATAVVAVAVAADGAIRVVAEAERREGLEAIEASSSLEDARARLAVVSERWAPAWALLDELAIAQDIAADAAEAGEAPSLAELSRAYCALRVALASVVTVPPIPILGCAP